MDNIEGKALDEKDQSKENISKAWGALWRMLKPGWKCCGHHSQSWKEKKVVKYWSAKVTGTKELKWDSLLKEIDGMVIKVEWPLHYSTNLVIDITSSALGTASPSKAPTKLIILNLILGRTALFQAPGCCFFEPVSIGGVTVSSISMHNEEYIKEKDLRIGDTVLLEAGRRCYSADCKIIVSEVRTGTWTYNWLS